MRVTEALEQQTATSEILRVISSSPTGVEPVFEAIARSAITLCEADLSGVFTFDGELIHLVAQHGRTREEIDAVRRAFPQPPGRGSVTARAIFEAAAVQVADHSKDPEVAYSLRMYQTVLAVPMIRDRRPIGAISVARRVPRPFSDNEIELLKTFADQAVIAIENVGMFHELQARNAELTEALEQQTATAEILRVISSSPTDVQPVFDAIVRSAVRLCDGLYGFVGRFDGEQIHLAAHYNYTPEALRVVQQMYPMRPSREQASGRVIMTGSIVHIEDVLEDPEYAQELARAGGWRGLIGVPLLREEAPVGMIAVMRGRPGRFSDADRAQRPSRTRRSSPSRTCGSSPSCGHGRPS